jgi:hypothetical protein
VICLVSLERERCCDGVEEKKADDLRKIIVGYYIYSSAAIIIIPLTWALTLALTLVRCAFKVCCEIDGSDVHGH